MSEYLVAVVPGRELLYRTPLSLHAAMRSGEITAESRIFHRATSSWVPITEHPEYRKFQAERHSHPPAEPARPEPAWTQPAQPEPVQPEPAPLPATDETYQIAGEHRTAHGKRGLLRTLAGIAGTVNFPPLRRGSRRHRPRVAKAPEPARVAPAPTPPPRQPTVNGSQGPAPTRDRWTFYP